MPGLFLGPRAALNSGFLPSPHNILQGVRAMCIDYIGISAHQMPKNWQNIKLIDMGL